MTASNRVSISGARVRWIPRRNSTRVRPEVQLGSARRWGSSLHFEAWLIGSMRLLSLTSATRLRSMRPSKFCADTEVLNVWLSDSALAEKSFGRAHRYCGSRRGRPPDGPTFHCGRCAGRQ